MSELTPIFALIDADTMAALRPRVDDLVAELGPWVADPENPATFGWSPEMVAWGRILAAAATPPPEDAP